MKEDKRFIRENWCHKLTIQSIQRFVERPITAVFLFAIRSAISQLPDLFVSTVIREDEEEPLSDERNEAEKTEIYHCPVFMNRVSVGLILVQNFSFKYQERILCAWYVCAEKGSLLDYCCYLQ